MLPSKEKQLKIFKSLLGLLLFPMPTDPRVLTPNGRESKLRAKAGQMLCLVVNTVD